MTENDPTTENNPTFETRVLDHYPDIRMQILASPPFGAWLKTLTALEVDGETLYLRGGDMLRDRDQVVFEWARKSGLLTDAAVVQALTQEEREQS